MKVVSVDVETTGLDPRKDQILEFAAVLFDLPGEPIDHFHRLVWHERIEGHPRALAMNAAILVELADADRPVSLKVVHVHGLYSDFRSWLYRHVGDAKVTLAGKNAGAFDLQFLRSLPGWRDDLFRHRILDPGSLYFNPGLDSDYLPDLATCRERAGLDKQVKHRALHDAIAVMECIRAYYDQEPYHVATQQGQGTAGSEGPA